jgi:hypothetical protein
VRLGAGARKLGKVFLERKIVGPAGLYDFQATRENTTSCPLSQHCSDLFLCCTPDTRIRSPSIMSAAQLLNPKAESRVSCDLFELKTIANGRPAARGSSASEHFSGRGLTEGRRRIYVSLRNKGLRIN